MNPENMSAFKALSFRDRWRINSLLRRGEAPQDRKLAAAAIELADNYQRAHDRAYWERVRWFVVFVAVTCGATAVWFGTGTGGEVLMAAMLMVAALTNIAALTISPMFWPKNVARSLEACRAVVGSGE